jgi:Tfp pilus assembly protein PilP
MKKILCLCLLLSAATAYSDDAKNEWHNTTLSEATIEKIQAAKFEYKKCVSDEMQKPPYQQQDSRNATEAIIKQCEPVLAKMREVYTDAKVPGTIADRHLKQMRLQTTRDVLQNMMFSEASRKAGNKPQ